jgi:hypothetical protein
MRSAASLYNEASMMRVLLSVLQMDGVVMQRGFAGKFAVPP